MSKPSPMLELTVEQNPQVDDGVMVMTGEGITLTIKPSKDISYSNKGNGSDGDD